MEPVTHVLTGACLARAGFNRKAAYATLTMALAAEMPDLDTVWGWRGPVEGFAHHRGITHTFVGLPFEAAILLGAVYALHRWRVWRSRTSSVSMKSTRMKRPADGAGTDEWVARPLTQAPVRWGALYGFALLGLLSHLLLDYTNNYGLRPFYPFNPHWYAASIVFIFDPLIFTLLLAALVLPWLFGLVSAEVGARRAAFRGRGLAIAALLGVVALWSLRWVEHRRAVELAMAQSIAQPVRPAGDRDITASDVIEGVTPPRDGLAPASDGMTPAGDAVAPQGDGVAPPEPPQVYLTAQRVLASPDPLNPFAWSTATDFGPVYQLAEVNALSGTSAANEGFLWKPGGDTQTRQAEGSPLGRVYIDWSPMPVITVGDAEPVPGLGLERVVTFQDPRFMGGWMARVGRDALVGTVMLDAQGKVVRQTMGGKIDREIAP